mgnify:CR=1 FL=1
MTVIYLFAIVRFFFALSGLDSGSSFAGIGASRELTLGVLVEPSLVLSSLALDGAKVYVVNKDDGAVRSLNLQAEGELPGEVTPPVEAGTLVRLHHEAHERCFIANSVNFPVRNEPVVTAA